MKIERVVSTFSRGIMAVMITEKPGEILELGQSVEMTDPLSDRAINAQVTRVEYFQNPETLELIGNNFGISLKGDFVLSAEHEGWIVTAC